MMRAGYPDPWHWGLNTITDIITEAAKSGEQTAHR